MTSPRHLGPDQGAEPKAIWSIVVGEATQRWVERTGRRPNDFFNGLLGAQRIPDPTTAGEFCRRFAQEDVEYLMSVFNETRL
jgi:hypothetical protein